MGFWWQCLPTPQPGGEILKSKYYQYIIRVLILLGTATSMAFLLLAWTQPFDLQSLALHWDRHFSLGVTPQMKETGKSLTEDVFQKRGVGLLHAWADSELFLRAWTNERIVGKEQNSSSSRTPKIAFMFLIQNELPFAPLWNEFFKGHEGLYNIYIHSWPLKLSAIQRSKGVFWGRLIPSLEGKRNTPGLIADARRLLANALLDDSSNEWFAVISESCIPLHGFRHVYNTLASTNKSFLLGLFGLQRQPFRLLDNWDSSPEHWDMWNRYVARGDDVMKPEIQFSQFRVGSQFWVMRRKHAAMTICDTKYWTKFNKPCVPQHAYCFPEEHYFATLMNFLDPDGLHHSATMVDWSRMEPGGHPTRFKSDEITLNFIKGLQQRADGSFLFARKFHPDCLETLMEFANSILEY